MFALRSLLSLMACTALAPQDTALPSGTSAAGTDAADTGAAPPPSDDSDESVLRQAIAGERDAADALTTIAASGGLPVQTDDGTFLFACLCGPGDWMLAGDHEGWAGQSMSLAGELSWIEVEIPSPDGSLYKLTDGTSWIADPMGRRFGWDEFGEFSLVRSTAAHVERWYDLSGSGLTGRDLQVWVPDGGVFTHMLLAHDGQNLFDPEAAWGGWRLQDSLPEGVLVVGIENTSDRIEEYTHTTDVIHGQTWGGWGDDYAALVEETIRPAMTEAYGEPEVIGLLGSSLGGLISFYIAHLYPDRYDMAISMSGTMGWGSITVNNPTMIDLYAEAGHRDVALYLDSGGSGTCYDADGDGIEDDDPNSTDNYCTNIQLRDTLEGVGYTAEVDLWHWHELDAEHNEYAWAERVFRPLQIFADL